MHDENTTAQYMAKLQEDIDSFFKKNDFTEAERSCAKAFTLTVLAQVSIAEATNGDERIDFIIGQTFGQLLNLLARAHNLDERALEKVQAACDYVVDHFNAKQTGETPDTSSYH
jgi:hypothetical protein